MRYCGFDLRPKAPVVRGILFTHLGFRYMLGAFVTAGAGRRRWPLLRGIGRTRRCQVPPPVFHLGAGVFPLTPLMLGRAATAAPERAKNAATIQRVVVTPIQAPAGPASA